MKKAALLATALVTLCGSAVYAQGVDVQIGGDRGVRVEGGFRGDRDRDRDRDWRNSRNETVIIKKKRGWRDDDDYDRPRRRVYIERD